MNMTAVRTTLVHVTTSAVRSRCRWNVHEPLPTPVFHLHRRSLAFPPHSLVPPSLLSYRRRIRFTKRLLTLRTGRLILDVCRRVFHRVKPASTHDCHHPQQSRRGGRRSHDRTATPIAVWLRPSGAASKSQDYLRPHDVLRRSTASLPAVNI